GQDLIAPLETASPAETPGWGLERKLQVAFEDVALYFTREEWELLSQPEKQLYRDQMLRNYWALRMLGERERSPWWGENMGAAITKWVGHCSRIENILVHF
uniref:KRAB domain-containing protein n=1 Tax=Chrysemys picta bellii TaxID=8478 RepID=A0A8C3FX56_CHRPI